MVKKSNHNIIYFIKYYRIIQLLMLAAIFMLINGRLIKLISIATYVREGNIFYKIYCIFIPVSIVFTWLMIAFVIIRGRYYRYITGRILWKDMRKYSLTYRQLKDYFQDADPHRLDADVFPKASWRTTAGLIFGKSGKHLIYIPSNSECNIAVFGPPGSGKTSGIAIINALQFEGSVLAIDIKGDLYSYCKDKRNIVRFCPDVPDALKSSAGFNPFAEINNMDATSKKLYIENMATILIPDEGGSDGNYFTSRARHFFQGITHLILSESPHISFPEVIHACLQGNPFEWVKKAIDSNCIEAKEYLASFWGNSEKNVSGAYNALTSALIPFSNPVLDKLLDGHGDNCISMHTLDSGKDIYLQISQEHLNIYAPLFTLIMQSLSTAFVKRSDSSTGITNRPILMILDEFPQLTFSYSMINTNLSTLRSKSVICLLIQQNLSQLEWKYQPIGARSILGNCGYQLILGSNDITSSKAFSELFGTKKILKEISGHGIQEAREPIFQATDFGDLPSKNRIIIYFNGKHLSCTKLSCYKD